MKHARSLPALSPVSTLAAGLAASVVLASASLAAPALLIFGGKDSITPPRMGEYLHRHLPHSELHIIEKAAHAPFLTHAAQFAAWLADFFNRC